MIIETEGLTKVYGNKTACDLINLEVEAGQVYGFLGRNGAGKSTCIKMLLGLIFPTSGGGTVLGKPLGDVTAREKLGYLPELFRYQDWMTGLDLLNFHAQLSRLKNKNERIQRVLQLVGLEGQEKYKVGSYSKGMQQRIGLACALLPEPQLIFLDEPTSALDPIGRKEVRDIIFSLKNEGATVFLNSHLLSEVEAVCDRVTFIHKGKIVKSASMEELLMGEISLTLRAKGVSEESLMSIVKQSEQGKLGRLSEQFELDKLDELDNHGELGEHSGHVDLAEPDKLGKLDSQDKFGKGKRLVERIGEDTFHVVLRDYEEIPTLANRLIAQGATLYEMTPHHETLETVFMQLVGEEE
ncbi:ABC transporter ATP-binding protein [Desulfitobacterium sp. THU1]|uniref:ABC transporter ATP-binding protein n=1 Tax=Desulfitobacterium sp. THU1 TaxID=3138072 RepID=UPI00311DE09E